MGAGHYLAIDDISFEMDFLLWSTACAMSISVTPRFHKGVQMIWNTANRWLYLRLFFLYVVLCYMLALKTAGPSLWAQVAALGPSFAIISDAHSTFQRSSLGSLVLSGFSF